MGNSFCIIMKIIEESSEEEKREDSNDLKMTEEFRKNAKDKKMKLLKNIKEKQEKILSNKEI